jgi:hypothetical protein
MLTILTQFIIVFLNGIKADLDVKSCEYGEHVDVSECLTSLKNKLLPAQLTA